MIQTSELINYYFHFPKLVNSYQLYAPGTPRYQDPTNKRAFYIIPTTGLLSGCRDLTFSRGSQPGLNYLKWDNLVFSVG